MNPDSLEKVLARYGPTGPPDGLKDQLLEVASYRERGRRRARRILTAAGAAALVAAFVNFQADHVYEEAIRVSQGSAQPQSAGVNIPMSVVSVHIPGARAFVAWNGGSHE